MMYMYRVVDENNESYSGYNNMSGVYNTLLGAECFIRYTTRGLKSRGRKVPQFRIQYMEIHWKDLSDG